MKKIFILIFLISSLKFHSQNPELFQNNWYLTEFIKGGITYYPPSNITVPFVPLNFSVDLGNSLNTTVCNQLSASNLTFDDVNSTFSYLDYGATLGNCPLSSDNFFDQNYLGFYYTDLAPITMHYSINQQNDFLSLIITSSTNDVAIYNSQLLSIHSQDERLVLCYPNPTSGLINLKMEGIQESVTNIKIFNSIGQTVKSTSFYSLSNLIDITDFNAGIYFIEIDIDEKREIIKIIKI